MIATLSMISKIQAMEPFLPQLDALHIGFNEIKTFGPISGFARLKLLNIENNIIESWSEVQRFSQLPRYFFRFETCSCKCSLEKLFLQQNQIRTIQVAGGFLKLKFINFIENHIDSVMALSFYTVSMF